MINAGGYVVGSLTDKDKGELTGYFVYFDKEMNVFELGTGKQSIAIDEAENVAFIRRSKEGALSRHRRFKQI